MCGTHRSKAFLPTSVLTLPNIISNNEEINVFAEEALLSSSSKGPLCEWSIFPVSSSPWMLSCKSPDADLASPPQLPHTVTLFHDTQYLFPANFPTSSTPWMVMTFCQANVCCCAKRESGFLAP